MKIKELQKSVNVAWSPAQLPSVMLAAGTAAQQMDLASSASSVLEVYDANLTEAGYDMVVRGSQVSQYRFHKLIWSPLGIGGSHADGVIVAGCESGHLQVYDAGRLLSGQEACIATQCKHTGAVRALDINPFQTNLLASGASESEILIWDLNSTGTPMMPGTSTQPAEDIQALGWNRQVQHILASVFSARCVVWDLRKNESVIKLNDSQSRVRWRALQWHPEVATQLWLASEDDQSPVAQLWDLRYATAPARTVSVHQRGILGMSWCPRDTGLMVSCGKDNRIVCWDPTEEQKGAEILSEVASTVHWFSDVQWCPRNPALLAGTSLDGNVSVYSLYGGQQQQLQTSNKIADSFPGMETMAHAPLPQQQSQPIKYEDLRRPPKWMRTPVGAKFAFGGKLVTFNETAKTVTLNQVITDSELIVRSEKLENVLASGNFSEYCKEKADQMTSQHGRYVWYFLKANFDTNPREQMLNLLGYNADDMDAKFSSFVPKSDENIDQLTKNMASLSRSYSSDMDGHSTDDSTDSSNIAPGTADPFDAIAANETARAAIAADIPYKISTGDDTESLIGQALLIGRREAAVELCLADGRFADAIIIAMTGGSELLARTQCRYLQRQRGYLANIISALVTDDWSGVVAQCTTDSWREALAATLTHATDQMPELCERLGERLLAVDDSDADGSSGGSSSKPSTAALESAILCYICAGNVERLVAAWPCVEQAIGDLQELVEIVMVLQKALELQGRHNDGASGKLADLLARYAGFLAAQGALNSALSYLGPSVDPQVVDLRERLYYSLGHKQAYAATSRQHQQNQPHSQHFSHPLPKTHQQRSSFSAQPTPLAYPGAPTPLSTWQPPALAPTNQWNTTPVQGGQSIVTQPTVWNPPQVATTATHPPVGLPPIGPAPSSTGQQPPRPPSVGAHGVASRSKYVRDPSVQNGSAAGYTPINNPYTPQTPFNNNAAFVQPSVLQQSYGGGSNVYAPTPYNNNPISTPTNVFTPFTPAPVSTGLVPGSEYLAGVPPVELAQSALTGNVRARTPPPGWNDPPALKTTRKPPGLYYPTELCEHHEMSAEHAGTRRWAKLRRSHEARGVQPDYTRNTGTPGSQSAADGNAPSTDTSGLYNPNAHQPHASGYPPTFQTQQPHPSYAPFQPQQAPQPVQQPITGVYQPNAQHQFNNNSFVPGPQQPSAVQQNAAALRQPTPEPPRAKQPLPEEYVYMQTVFNELKLQCSQNGANPQIKRKLEDVGKRLESLYDLLREDRLSANTLTPLNQLVQLVQTGDYVNALALHTQMVSGPDFAQIASFMPGIKTLLQIATQLQVFLR